MPNAAILRRIVVTLRGLAWRARNAGSPTAAVAITMAAGAVQDVAGEGEKNPKRKAVGEG